MRSAYNFESAESELVQLELEVIPSQLQAEESSTASSLSSFTSSSCEFKDLEMLDGNNESSELWNLVLRAVPVGRFQEFDAEAQVSLKLPQVRFINENRKLFLRGLIDDADH